MVTAQSTWEDGFAVDHLAENAAHRPHIYGLGVLCGAQENFRGPIPAGGHVLRQNSVVLRLILQNRSREAEVRDLHVAVGVEEDVGRLQVAMDDFRRMDVLQGLEDLVDYVARGLIGRSTVGEFLRGCFRE